MPDKEDGYSHQNIKGSPNWPKRPVGWGVGWFSKSLVPSWDCFEGEKAADAASGKAGKDTDDELDDTIQVHSWLLVLLLCSVLYQDYSRLQLGEYHGYRLNNKVEGRRHQIVTSALFS